MSEPRRLVDDGAADPELVRLLRSARPSRPLDAATFGRSQRRVMALGSVPAALGVLVWVKQAALGAVLGLTVAAAASAPRFLAKATDAVPPASGVPRGEATARPPATPRADAVVVPEASKASPVRGAPLTSAPAESASVGLSREVALLEAARGELDRRPGSALSLLAQHEREFARGALALEREFLVVSALVRLGRRREAEAHAAALRTRSPGSLYEQRLRELFRDSDGPQ